MVGPRDAHRTLRRQRRIRKRSRALDSGVLKTHAAQHGKPAEFGRGLRVSGVHFFRDDARHRKGRYRGAGGRPVTRLTGEEGIGEPIVEVVALHHRVVEDAIPPRSQKLADVVVVDARGRVPLLHTIGSNVVPSRTVGREPAMLAAVIEPRLEGHGHRQPRKRVPQICLHILDILGRVIGLAEAKTEEVVEVGADPDRRAVGLRENRPGGVFRGIIGDADAAVPPRLESTFIVSVRRGVVGSTEIQPRVRPLLSRLEAELGLLRQLREVRKPASQRGVEEFVGSVRKPRRDARGLVGRIARCGPGFDLRAAHPGVVGHPIGRGDVPIRTVIAELEVIEGRADPDPGARVQPVFQFSGNTRANPRIRLVKLARPRADQVVDEGPPHLHAIAGVGRL